MANTINMNDDALLEKGAISLINCFNDAVILFRKENSAGSVCFLDVNNAALELFGYTKDEFHLLGLGDIFFKSTYSNFNKAKDLTKNSEGYCTDKSGRIFPVEFYVNSIDPKDDSSILVIKDITVKKQNEHQLSRYIEELHEHKDIMERNAFDLVLLNVKLEESEEELKKLNASKDKFFSIIAHDLKSPFTSFIGLTELLAEDFDEMDLGEIKQLIIELNKNAKSFYGLLENLLSWARVQTGRMDFAPEYLSPLQIAENIQGLYSPSALQKNIDLFFTVLTKKHIYADLNMIETIMRNLVSNAVKFTPEGGRIEIKAVDIEDGMVEFSIIDSGAGINPEDFSKLFRIDINHSTLGTKNEKGTGLGLVLCKDLAEMNGGILGVENNADCGTRFYFSVPTSPSAEE